MREHGRTLLYDATVKGGLTELTDWPGKLRILVRYSKHGHHNIARWQYFYWFEFEDRKWFGVRYGDNTQIVHCRRLKN